MKTKRYVIEFSNDIEKRLTEAGRTEDAGRVLNIRNSYICGFVTELDAIRSILKYAEEV